MLVLEVLDLQQDLLPLFDSLTEVHVRNIRAEERRVLQVLIELIIVLREVAGNRFHVEVLTHFLEVDEEVEQALSQFDVSFPELFGGLDLKVFDEVLEVLEDIH